MRTRLAIGALGLAAGLWGVWLLADDGTDRLVSTGTWLAAGVIAHDAVLAPVVVGLGVVATKVLPGRTRSVLAIGFVVWGALTVAVANVLIGQGGKPGMDSLLHRPYVASWLVVTVVIAAVTAGYAVIVAKARRGDRL